MSRIQELMKRIARLELRRAHWRVFASPFTDDDRYRMLESVRQGYALLLLTWEDEQTPDWVDDLCEELGVEEIQLEFGDG